MREARVWLLTVAGLVGLLTALSFEARVTPRGWTFRSGFPDTLAEGEWTSGDYAGHLYFISWSFGILVASVYALCCAVRLSRRMPPQKPAGPGATPDPRAPSVSGTSSAIHRRPVRRFVRHN